MNRGMVFIWSWWGLTNYLVQMQDARLSTLSCGVEMTKLQTWWMPVIILNPAVTSRSWSGHVSPEMHVRACPDISERLGTSKVA